MTAVTERLDRMRADCVAGRALEAADAIALVNAFDGVEQGRSLDQGMGLIPGWRQARAREAVCGAGLTAAALHTALTRYRAAGFTADRDAGREPDGDKRVLFQTLVATRGKVPSQVTLRRWLRSNNF